MNTIQKFEFAKQLIDFEVENGNVMINATQMAKTFGKRIDFFLKTDHANEFIKVMELTPFGGSSTPLKRHEIVKTRNGVNTFFHRILALKFAAWLSPEFELWVYAKIDEILYDYYRRLEESLKRSAERITEIEKLEEDLNALPEFQKLERLKFEERQEKNKRAKENRNQLEMFKEISE